VVERYLFAAFYECGTWPFTLTEEHRLRILVDTMQRRLFGARMVDIIAGQRKVPEEVVYNFYSSLNNLKEDD
jgi:hypothetical protein